MGFNDKSKIKYVTEKILYLMDSIYNSKGTIVRARLLYEAEIWDRRKWKETKRVQSRFVKMSPRLILTAE